jgi:hypothetical protein
MDAMAVILKCRSLDHNMAYAARDLSGMSYLASSFVVFSNHYSCAIWQADVGHQDTAPLDELGNLSSCIKLGLGCDVGQSHLFLA